MIDNNVFQPAVEVHYTDLEDEVLVQTFSLNGRVHTQPPRKLRHGALPVLLFQLVDRGYEVMPEPVKFGVRVIRAFSPEFVARVRAEAAKAAQS